MEGGANEYEGGGVSFKAQEPATATTNMDKANTEGISFLFIIKLRISRISTQVYVIHIAFPNTSLTISERKFADTVEKSIFTKSVKSLCFGSLSNSVKEGV